MCTPLGGRLVGRDTPRGLRFPSCLTYQVMLLGYLLGIQRILRTWVEPQFPRPNSLSLQKTPLYITTRIVDISLKLSSVVRTVKEGYAQNLRKVNHSWASIKSGLLEIMQHHGSFNNRAQFSRFQLAAAIFRPISCRRLHHSPTVPTPARSLAHSRSTPFRSLIIPSPTSGTVF